MAAESAKDWAKVVISLYEEGCDDAEVAAALRITLKEYYKQLSDNPAFAQLVDFGRTLCRAFWEGQFRKNLNTKGYNTAMLAFYMKNKYGWADKTESVNTNENSNMNLDALREQVTNQVNRFIRENTPELTDAQRTLKSLTLAEHDD